MKSGTASYEQATIKSDQEIIRRIREGDETALVEVYQNNITMVNKFIRENSGYPEDAEDMLQEAIVILWENVQKNDFDLTSKISTYLYSIVRNRWFREISRRKIGKMGNIDDYVIVEESKDALKNVIRNEEYKMILECINMLGPTCKKILSLFYLEEKGMDEIARLLGFSNADVAKAKKWQCKKELELLIKRQYR